MQYYLEQIASKKLYAFNFLMMGVNVAGETFEFKITPQGVQCHAILIMQRSFIQEFGKYYSVLNLEI